MKLRYIISSVIVLLAVVVGMILFTRQGNSAPTTPRLVPHPCYVEPSSIAAPTGNPIPEDEPYLGNEPITRENAANLVLFHRSEIWLPADGFIITSEFNSDSSLLAIQANIPLLRVIEVHTGEIIWNRDAGVVSRVYAFTPQNILLSDVGVTVNDVFSDTTLMTYSLGINARMTSIAVNERCIALGANDKKIRFTTLEGSDQWIGILDARNGISNLAFSPDGLWLAYSTAGNNDSGGPAIFSLWNLERNEEVIDRRLENGNTDESDIVFSRDSRLVAVAYYGRIDVYEVTVPLWRYTLDEDGSEFYYGQLGFNSDATILAGGTSDGVIKLWDTDTGDLIASYQIDQPILDLTFNHESRNLLVVDRSGTLWYWGIE